MSINFMDDKEHEKKLNDIRWVLSTPQGRRFYWRLLEECGAFKDRYVEDSNLCYYQKGQRSIGLNLFHDVFEAKPEAFIQMQQERDSQKVRENIKTKRKIKEKQPLTIDSPSLPNTELVTSQGV